MIATFRRRSSPRKREPRALLLVPAFGKKEFASCYWVLGAGGADGGGMRLAVLAVPSGAQRT